MNSTVKVTRWWWIRHAPVVGHGGRIYGQDDHDCDCSHSALFAALARHLPAPAVWITSHLRRTHQTAEAILAHLPPHAVATRLVEPDLAEQHFGTWQGRHAEELCTQRDGAWHRFWLAPAEHAPPGGESFVDLMARVSTAVERLTAAHTGTDIVAVTHGGTIRAAIAHALGLDPERALAFAIDNCALTCLDHIHGPAGSHAPHDHGVWRVRHVNLRPQAS
ncbi:MAG: histidine phosphatase family protein [Alphaproteobacteria bacterium]|nr:MAG: histidine phosphatase family protein [Alphaproteobacteria bacterium]